MSKELIEAAFVALYDYALADEKLSIPFGLIDLIAGRVRAGIPLTRADAQAALRDGAPEGRAAAALVLTYEGVGGRRAEPDFTFSAEDIMALGEARARIKLPLRRAVAILAIDSH